jgi:23S rRNA (adenine2503-C2)-methyltransferase
MSKRHILGFTPAELKATFKDIGVAPFRASQVWDWVYKKGVINPEEMVNIAKREREVMVEHLSFDEFEVTSEQQSIDGTTKWLFKLHDGHEIETVFIPEPNRGTLCVSSQVGCTLNCRFCHTGTQGLSRNLLRSEIVGQTWMAKKLLGEWTDTPFNLLEHIKKTGFDDQWMYDSFDRNKSDSSERRVVSNIVFMGMGEPLFNWDNVKESLDIVMNEKGFGFGSRRITISTSGMVPNITAVGHELGVNLAVSIHAADDETRTKIMPVNKRWPIAELIKTIKIFPLKERRRITWEYVMLKGVNDTAWHARELVKLIEGIPSFVNIITFNEWPGSPFECSTGRSINDFRDVIANAGIDVNIRRSRGDDILAACGQLRGETSDFNTVVGQAESVISEYGSDKQKQKIKVNIQ